MHEERLYFNAYVDGSDPAAVTLTGPGVAPQKIAFSDKCIGAFVGIGSSSGTTDLFEECSFDLSGRTDGVYHVAIVDGASELVAVDVRGRVVPYAAERSGLALDPDGRGGTAFHRGPDLLYYHTMDVTDPVGLIEFLWIRDGQIVEVGEGVAQGPRLDRFGPPIEVVGVAGPRAPRPRGDTTTMTLLVFRDGTDFLGAFELVGADAFAVPLTPIPPPNDQVLRAAQARALAHMNEKVKPQYFDRQIPESLACAVLSDPAAAKAYGDKLRNDNAAHWDWYDAAVAHDKSLDDGITERQRAKLKGKMVEKAQDRRTHLDQASHSRRELETHAKKRQEGCLEELAGFSSGTDARQGRAED